MGNKPLVKMQKNEIEIIKCMYLDLLKKQKSYIEALVYANSESQKKLEKKISILQKEVDEYRGFKKGKIWNYLKKYRSLKKYLNDKKHSI